MAIEHPPEIRTGINFDVPTVHGKELEPTTILGRFYRVTVTIDGEEEVSLYENITTKAGRIFSIASDLLSWKRSGIHESEISHETNDEYRRYLETVQTVPVPRNADGEEIDLVGVSFYFTEEDYNTRIRSGDYLESVLNQASQNIPNKYYDHVDVRVEAIQDPANVVYVDDHQIAITEH